MTAAPTPAPSLGLIARIIAFVRSPQGKRDIALITAAAGGVIDGLKQFKLL